MTDKIIIPPFMVDRIKANIIFKGNLSNILNELYGKDKWIFIDSPKEEEIENAETHFQQRLDGEAAIELWQRFFNGHDAPWETNDYGQTYCFFCAADHPDHHSDCIYVAAAKLLGREPTIKVGF